MSRSLQNQLTTINHLKKEVRELYDKLQSVEDLANLALTEVDEREYYQQMLNNLSWWCQRGRNVIFNGFAPGLADLRRNKKEELINANQG